MITGFGGGWIEADGVAMASSGEAEALHRLRMAREGLRLRRSHAGP